MNIFIVKILINVIEMGNKIGKNIHSIVLLLYSFFFRSGKSVERKGKIFRSDASHSGPGRIQSVPKIKIGEYGISNLFHLFEEENTLKNVIQSIIKFSIGFNSVVQAWEQSKSAAIL